LLGIFLYGGRTLKIIESVPNFSEGKNEEIVEEIVTQAKKTGKVWVLDYSSDKDHNRSVVTLAGEPDDMMEALFLMVKKASELIDLRKHHGEHPRVGATDVIPLIPILNSSVDECITISHKLGEKIGKELNIPVFMYEKSASASYRKNLSNIRKGEFENFPEKIKLEEWKPDYGPDIVHETAGVTVVGCREPLIAFNVDLNTNDLQIAQKIAKAVRHISGGFRYVKALGFRLEEKGIVQISMNLTNYKRTPIYRVFEVIKNEAERYGVQILGSEIIGLVPQRAVCEVAEYYLRINKFDQSYVLENNILAKSNE
jgi:glutamate formiminotransferase